MSCVKTTTMKGTGGSTSAHGPGVECRVDIQEVGALIDQKNKANIARLGLAGGAGRVMAPEAPTSAAAKERKTDR